MGIFDVPPPLTPGVRKETPSEFMRLIFSWLLFCSETCLEPWYVCEETSGLCPRGLPWWQLLTHHLGEFSSSARCDQKILDEIKVLEKLDLAVVFLHFCHGSLEKRTQNAELCVYLQCPIIHKISPNSAFPQILVRLCP